jgi:hypothetical protein
MIFRFSLYRNQKARVKINRVKNFIRKKENPMNFLSVLTCKNKRRNLGT